MSNSIPLTLDDASAAEDDHTGRPTFLQHFIQRNAGSIINVSQMDHNYAKPWDASADLQGHAKAASFLFIHPNESVMAPSCGDIDVESVDEPNILPYDQQRARSLMAECERNVNFARATQVSDDSWEDTVNREGWTPAQVRLFNRVIKILQGDRLSRLAFAGHINEPIMRRLSIDKTAKRVRHAFASAEWDPTLARWLHTTLTNCLGQSLLAAYLDVQQVLRAKAPNQVDVMMTPDNPADETPTNEALSLLLKRPWDPIASFMALHRLGKLPGGASLVIVPDVPADHVDTLWVPAAVRRAKFWNSQLSGLGKIVQVTVPASTTRTKFITAVEVAVRKKCSELRSRHPNRALVLIGWQVGAMMACRVSLVESVTAVVALGFPTHSSQGSVCGNADDPLLTSKTPTLFVVGQNATTCCLDDLEDMREQMNVNTSLVVVGGADDRLRMSHSRRRSEAVTQSMVDRCVVDKIAEFLHSVVSGSPETTPIKTAEAADNTVKLVAPKRHKGRPPGSRSHSLCDPMAGGDAQVMLGQSSDQRLLTVSLSSDHGQASPAKRRRRMMSHNPPTSKHPPTVPPFNLPTISSHVTSAAQGQNFPLNIAYQMCSQPTATFGSKDINLMQLAASLGSVANPSAAALASTLQQFAAAGTPLTLTRTPMSAAMPMSYNIIRMTSCADPMQAGSTEKLAVWTGPSWNAQNATFLTPSTAQQSNIATSFNLQSSSSALGPLTVSTADAADGDHSSSLPSPPVATTRTRVIKTPRHLLDE